MRTLAVLTAAVTTCLFSPAAFVTKAAFITPAAAQGSADVDDVEIAGKSRLAGTRDAAFGPPIVIEGIEIEGNTSTATRIIMRALPFAVGDAMRAGDPRLRAARVKILALGFFRHVEPIKLRRGSRRGQVIATIRVVERGTVILNRMWFGTSLQTPWWVGLDATERNLAGTGLSVGGAFVFAGKGEAAGSRSQRAGELRLADPSILGTKIGVHGSFHWVRASEPFRISGEPSDDRPSAFNAFDYRRVGGRAGMSIALTPLSRLGLGLRYERVTARTPAAATREFADGSIRPIDFFLRAGTSNVSTASISFDRDTRSDPVLPFDGDRVQMFGELGAGVFGSSYDYGIVLAKYERWWALRSPMHVISIHLTGGVVNGDAPRFDRFHVGDLNRLVTPRALGLVVSTTPSRDFFNTASDDVNYGEVGGIAEVQYARRLFRRSRFVYGGDVFIGAGVWGLANANALRVRDRSAAKALPIDLLIDIGLRLDTEIGIFELSLANGLGRVPL